MHDDIDRLQLLTRWPSPKYIARPPLEPMPNHRITNLAAGRNTKACMVVVIGVDME